MGQHNELVGEIYVAAVDVSRLPNVLDKIVASSGGVAASLLLCDRTGATGTLALGVGYPEDTIKAYTAYFSALNPLSVSTALHPVGTVIGIETTESTAGFSKSEFFNDFLLKWGMGAGAQVAVARGSFGHMHFSLELPYGRVSRDQVELEHFVKGLVPHLAHALETNRKFQSLELARDQTFGILDFIGEAAFLIDSQLRVVSMNTDAQGKLHSQTDFAVRGDHLCFSALKAQAYLEMMARLSVKGNLSALSVPHLMNTAKGRLLLRVWPLPNRLGGGNSDYRLADLAQPLLCVTITNLDSKPVVGAVSAAQLFGLTPAECRLAQAIAVGDELNHYADEHHVSRHTVRNQIKSVFAKMGVSRQVELVLLMQKLKV